MHRLARYANLSRDGTGEHGMRFSRLGSCTAAVLAALLSVANSNPAGAQLAPETDPVKCGAINLAHLYLRCINILEAHRSLLDGSRGGEITKQAQEASQKQQVLYMQWVLSLYQSAGRKYDASANDARRKADKPHVVAATEEFLERTMQTLTGERKPPKPNMYEECSVKGLGLEIHSIEKVNERLRAFRQEAVQLAQANQSCIKEN